MIKQVTEPPEAFEDLVRDALIHLYDPVALQAHPLVDVADLGSVATGKRLRQALLDAIETLHPHPGVVSSSRAWRLYRILELRYIEGREVSDVVDGIALSKSQYHREHRRALQAVACHLWDRWQLAQRWTSIANQGNVRAAADHGSERPRPESVTLGEGDGQVSPVDVLRGVVELVRPLCEQRGIEIRLTVHDDLPTLWGNRVSLRQAVLAILTHTIRVIERGVVELAAALLDQRIEIRISGPSTSVVVPLPAGLAESRPFVEALAGDLIYLPAAGEFGRWTVVLSFPTSMLPTLLVVDNERDFINLVKRYLTGLDWDVLGVPDVDHAFAVARERRPQAILLDVVIPDRDGWDLLQELKTTPATREIPVIICSVLDEPELATSLGAAAYLQKPLDQQRLISTLQRVWRA